MRTGRILYITYGDAYVPSSKNVSHYCGLPVLAHNESEAVSRTLAALGDGAKVAGVKVGTKVPVLDMASPWFASVAKELMS